jgi:hypothetical protein
MYNDVIKCLIFIVITTVKHFQAGFVVNLVCIQFTFGWRISLSVQTAIGCILACGMIFFPETPRYMHVHVRTLI